MDELTDHERDQIEALPDVYPFGALKVRELFRILRVHYSGRVQRTTDRFRKLGTDWAHKLDEWNRDVEGVQCIPNMLVQVDLMLLRSIADPDLRVDISNVAWNQIVTFAYKEGWQPKLPDEVVPTDPEQLELLQIYFESIPQMPHDDAKGLHATLKKVGGIPLDYYALDAEIIKSVCDLAYAGAFEIK